MFSEKRLEIEGMFLSFKVSLRVTKGKELSLSRFFAIFVVTSFSFCSLLLRELLVLFGVLCAAVLRFFPFW